MGRPRSLIIALLAFLSFSACLAGFPVPCHAVVQQYLHQPVFYSSVDEAFAAIRNMQNQFVGWKGTPAQKIDLDRYGLRVFGAMDYVVTNKEWVGNVITGGIKDVQKQVHEEELTIFPFDRLMDLQLNHYPDLNKEYKWGVVGILKGSNDPPAFRTPTKELAEILYNSIASLWAASGRPVSMSRLGAYFRDVSSDDLKSKEMQELGLADLKGMVVTYVMEGSPAKAGGLTAGNVIVACNDIPLVNYDQWDREIWATASSLTFKVLKKGGTTIRLVDPIPTEQLPKPPASLCFPATPAQPPAEAGQKPPKLGFSLRLPNDLEKQVLKGKTGAVISGITPNGLAEAARLQVGDILVDCNGKPIPGPEGLGSLLAGGENSFTVLRQGKTLVFKLAPEVNY